MRQLNFDLKTLQARHRGGVFVTRRDRSYALDQAANMLHAFGFRRLRATSLKRKHVNALVAEWQCRGLAAGTMKNRTARLRWWAKRSDRPGVVPSNGEPGVANREYVSDEDVSIVLDPENPYAGPSCLRRLRARWIPSINHPLNRDRGRDSLSMACDTAVSVSRRFSPRFSHGVHGTGLFHRIAEVAIAPDALLRHAP